MQVLVLKINDWPMWKKAFTVCSFNSLSTLYYNAIYNGDRIIFQAKDEEETPKILLWFWDVARGKINTWSLEGYMNERSDKFLQFNDSKTSFWSLETFYFLRQNLYQSLKQINNKTDKTRDVLVGLGVRVMGPDSFTGQPPSIIPGSWMAAKE